MTRQLRGALPSHEAVAGPCSVRRSVGLAVMAVAAVSMGVYALVAYTTRTPGSTVHPEMQAVFATHRVAILTHIFASSLAILLGPLQFVAGFRQRRPRAHRWVGRAYLGGGVLVGGVAGLYMSAFAFGGAVSTAGFASLALVWLYTGWRAYASARARDFAAHRAWMIRNFALTLAAVTIRVGIGAGSAVGLPFEAFYPALTWLCWVPNLILAEWMLRRR